MRYVVICSLGSCAVLLSVLLGVSRYDPSGTVRAEAAPAAAAVGSTGATVPASPAVLIRDAAPEPFITKCSFDLDVLRSGEGQVEIVDRRGEVVRTIFDGPFAAGSASFTWDGRNDSGNYVPPGRYGFLVRAGGVAEIRWVTYLQGNE